jgi:hypothetical protein
VFACGRVFGLYVYSFWFESDRRGGISGLLSLDGLVFTCGRYDPPSPLDARRILYPFYDKDLGNSTLCPNVVRSRQRTRVSIFALNYARAMK